MPRKSKPHQREEILEAAVELFGELGYKKTTMEDLAERVGISKATFYNYFRDKEDLYRQTCAFALTRWQDWARERSAGVGDPLAKFTTLAREAFYFLARNPSIHRLLRRDPTIFPLFLEDHYADINLASENILRATLQEGVEKGLFTISDLDSVTRILFSMYKMLIVGSYIEHPEMKLEDFFEDWLELVLRGILSRGNDNHSGVDKRKAGRERRKREGR